MALTQSPLVAEHRALDANLVEFGGWEMPIAYPSGTIAEHQACRTGAALFDVSHLGTVRVQGTEAFDVLQQFDFLAGYDSGHGVKPEAGMVLAFCQQTGLSCEEVVVVGDNRHDIEMGRNAQAGLCVGVLTGTSERSDLETIAKNPGNPASQSRAN